MRRDKGHMEISVPLSQFCHKCKTGLKEVFKIFKKGKWPPQNYHSVLNMCWWYLLEILLNGND